MATGKPLTIWAVSDGRIGIENQALGLAEAVARLIPAEIVVKRIRYASLFDRLPTALKLLPDAMLAPDSDPLTAPWPDIWIAAGRATLPHSLRMRARSGGRTMVVQLQDPNLAPDAFDLVIAPEHDTVSGDNVLSLTGSTNRVTAQKLTSEHEAFAAQLDSLPRPLVAVLVGGKSKSHDLSPQRAKALAADIRKAVTASGGSVLLTMSRRTPEAAANILRKALGGLSGILHDGSGPNPYYAFVAAADYLLVTEDSVNMTTEAATTGKPVYLLGMDSRRPAGKLARFQNDVIERGIARPFEGKLESWTYPPLDETSRAARRVAELVAERLAP